MKRIAGVGVALAFTIAIISTQSIALGSSPWTKVDEIVQGTGNKPWVKLSNPGDASTGCPAVGYVKLVDADSSPGKRQIAALLTALTTGKEVKIDATTCS